MESEDASSKIRRKCKDNYAAHARQSIIDRRNLSDFCLVPAGIRDIF